MRKLTLILALVALFAYHAAAQVTQVSGQVLDEENGEPLTGAVVLVEGTNNAVTTDIDGYFELKGLTPAHQSISVSYVGFSKKTQPAKAQMKIYLTPTSRQMDELIVVAFGKQKREALSGRVAGMQMTENNSLATGATPTIRVRGFSSLNANNQPLIVLDGLPYSGYLNDLNPADIENITVLKDAASNALYGARGANGVIMITTKNAKRGNTSVTLDAKWGVNTNGRTEYDLIDNAGEYYEAYYMGLRNYFMYRQENPMSFEQAHIQANNTLGLPDTKMGLGYMVYDVPLSRQLAERRYPQRFPSGVQHQCDRRQ